MANEMLKERVEKASEKVEKCKKTIERHEKQLAKRIAQGADKWDIESKEEDIVGAGKKLVDAERILENWKNKLGVAEEKKRYIEGNTPKVLKDFIDTWREQAYEWHIKRLETFKDFRVELRKKQEEVQLEYIKSAEEYKEDVGEDGELKTELRWLLSRSSAGLREYLKEVGYDWKGIQNRETSYAGAVVLKMAGIMDVNEREEWLGKTLDKERDSKMLDLITRINNAVGEIEDATDLRIGNNGNINGIIKGKSGSARVETIGAGGYNIQCFHFRTIITKL